MNGARPPPRRKLSWASPPPRTLLSSPTSSGELAVGRPFFARGVNPAADAAYVPAPDAALGHAATVESNILTPTARLACRMFYTFDSELPLCLDPACAVLAGWHLKACMGHWAVCVCEYAGLPGVTSLLSNATRHHAWLILLTQHGSAPPPLLQRCPSSSALRPSLPSTPAGTCPARRSDGRWSCRRRGRTWSRPR